MCVAKTNNAISSCFFVATMMSAAACSNNLFCTVRSDSILVAVLLRRQENPLVLLCDGHGSHLTWTFIQWARANHVMILLRPPHTTQVLQGEDVHGFGLFKKEYKSAKRTLMSSRYMELKRRLRLNLSTGGLIVDLLWEDMMGLVKDPWEHAFTRENILLAWARIGVSPFTRCVEHKLRKKEQEAAAVLIDESPLAAQARKAAMMLDNRQSDELAKDNALLRQEVTLLQQEIALLKAQLAAALSAGAVAHSAAPATPVAPSGRMRGSALWWGKSPITHGEGLEQRRAFEEQEAKEKEAAAATREERLNKSTMKVAALKAAGSKVLESNTPVEDMTVEELKQVLAVYEVYPNNKPSTPYAKGGKHGLVQQLLALMPVVSPDGAGADATPAVPAVVAAGDE